MEETTRSGKDAFSFCYYRVHDRGNACDAC